MIHAAQHNCHVRRRFLPSTSCKPAFHLPTNLRGTSTIELQDSLPRYERNDGLSALRGRIRPSASPLDQSIDFFRLFGVSSLRPVIPVSLYFSGNAVSSSLRRKLRDHESKRHATLSVTCQLRYVDGHLEVISMADRFSLVRVKGRPRGT